MGDKMCGIRSLLLALTLCIYAPAQAIVLLFSDYDNTITKDRENGNWVTYYELYRVHTTAMSAIPVPLDQPIKILISHKDWEDYEQLLSPNNGQTGHMMPVPLCDGMTENGKVIDQFIPGFYQKVDSLTYSRYRGDDYFNIDIKDPVNHWRLDRKKAM